MATFNEFFYNQTTRNTVVAFGNFFKDIKIKRTKVNGDVEKQFIVPIRYAPKEKFQEALLKESMQNGRVVDNIYPQLAFEITGITYDSTRKLNTMLNFSKQITNISKKRYTYTPSPYTINFSLYALGRYQDDILQVMEQIVPKFQPYVSVAVKEQEEMNIIRDIPVSLTGSELTFQYEGDEAPDSIRSVLLTLNFTAKIYYYRIVDEKNVITRVDVNFSELPSCGCLDIPLTDTDFGYTETIRLTANE